MDKVSVIVPTIGRDSLRAAVESVVAQEDCEPEAVVILDHPEKEDEIHSLLMGLPYVFATSQRHGAPAARNLGLQLASGDFIGYLDDDDLWMPDKARKQLASIKSSPNPLTTFSVVASEFIDSRGRSRKSAPRHFDPLRESFPNFLVSRRRLRYGSVLFNTPSLLGPQSLMREITWDISLKKHQDWDLLIRLFEVENVEFVTVNEPLVQVNQGSVGSISKRNNWQESAQWLEKHDERISGRARNDFILQHILLHAIRRKSREGVIASWEAKSLKPPHLAALGRLIAGLGLNR
ncbi:MAG: glycosyltransferase family 2 protein [Leucobacter sp.]